MIGNAWECMGMFRNAWECLGSGMLGNVWDFPGVEIHVLVEEAGNATYSMVEHHVQAFILLPLH